MRHLSRPPLALRKARLDNIVLIPGSALPQQAQYQAPANRLPAGEVLVVLPTAQHPERPLLGAIVALWRSRGRLVRTVTLTTR
jgi:anti-sigma factor ChrR (cupin superfamily)